jgi:predicted HTH domain antitoxin
MGSISVKQFLEHPDCLLADTRGGAITLVTQGGEPVFLALPLGKGAGSRGMKLELAVALYDHDQVSLGLAAQISGLPYSEIVDELGRRGIAVIRPGPGELDRELAALNDERCRR